MPQTTEVYILRHAKAQNGEFINHERPLSQEGEQQAKDLVPYLESLNCSALYSSPYLRAISTVEPFSEASGLPIQIVDNLKESAKEDPLKGVRERVFAVIHSIVAANAGGTILICTHGGVLYSIMSAFNPALTFDDYYKITNPDLKRFVYTGDSGVFDENFHFDLEPRGDDAQTKESGHP
jgi:2,3-bisphosphoglycerate-dependent phosphoglycerate mutase